MISIERPQNADAAAALTRAESSFRHVFGDGTASLLELRVRLDEMMLEEPPAVDVVVDHVEAGGVPCLRVNAGSQSPDSVAIWLHGGGYVMGSARGYRNVATRLSRALGSVVIVPDYRLAPEHPFPAALDDAVAVLSWTIEKFGAERTVVGGDSAGGGLTMAALLVLRDSAADLPAAAVLVSPLADFTASGASVDGNALTDVAISRRSIRNLAASYLQGEDPRNLLVSPVFGELSGLPPVLLLASDRETLLDDAVRLDERISAAGGFSELSIYQDVCHAWTMFAAFMPQGRAAVEEIGCFVRKVTA